MSLFSINKVYLLGNITKDIELRKTQSGKDVCSFSVATNMSVKDGDNYKDVPTFHNIVAWEGLARVASRLKKGDKVVIEGRTQKRDYENKDGMKIYVTEVVAEKVIGFEKLEKKTQPPQETQQDQEYEEEDVSDDIPF